MRANSKKGFTLIEVIAVMVILALVAVFGLASVDGFLEHADQEARDSVARTVFMAAQTALTHAYNQDRDFSKLGNFPGVPIEQVDAISPSLRAEELAKQGSLVYMVINRGVDNSGARMYQMLSPYLHDKTILNDSILIEYNKDTGMMLSAFYSEVPGVSFGYGSGGSYNVYNRGAAALKQARIGYYGVDSTGEIIRTDPIDSSGYSIRLIDYVNHQEDCYGLLTAEIGLPEDVADTLVFSLVLSPEAGTAETLTFAKSAAGVHFTLDELVTENIDTVEKAIAQPRTVGSRKIPVYYDSFGTSDKLVLVLDGVQSFTTAGVNRIGIRANFPNIVGGMLSGTLEISDGVDTEPLYSDDYGDRVHALYGADSTASALTVRSVRHLNNVRYCQDASRFEQRQSVYMWDYNRQQLNFTPISNRLDAWEESDGSGGTVANSGFYGTYVSSPVYGIFDLLIDLTGQTIPATPGANDMTLYNAGLFDTIRHGGSVSGVRFASTSAPTGAIPKALRVLHFSDTNGDVLDSAVAAVMGVDYAGGIAALNEGTIEDCTMLGYVSAAISGRSDGTAGGIAGANRNGAIRQCASVCSVTANRYAGGIAGSSDGSVGYCEAGTASWRSSTNSQELYLSGTPEYGAREGVSAYAGGTYTSNDTYRVKIRQVDGAAGGIVGFMSGAGTRVIGCVNACKVEAGNEGGEGSVSGGMAGGIAGYLAAADHNYTAVGYCYNAGAVYATLSAGGIVGEVLEGKIVCCYNTGYVNREYDFMRYESDDMTYFMPGTPRNLGGSDVKRSGGLLGCGSANTEITDCYSMQYTGNYYGGAFGILDNGATVTNCSFLQNILNATRNYYINDRDLKNTAINTLQTYGVTNMLTAPTGGNLDSTYFADGSLTGPVGTFGFLFPYLKASTDGSLPVHRTPWNPTIEKYGEIEFTEGALTRGSRIVCTFYLAPPEGKIYLRLNSESNRAETVIPLFEGRDRNSLDAVRRDGGWLDIYGYETDYGSYDEYVGKTPNYTFRIRATKLSTNNVYEALRIASGYSYRYELEMYYVEPDNKYTPIPDNTTLIVAELYNDHKSATERVSSDKLGDSNRLTLIDPPGLGQNTACVLEMDIDWVANHSVDVTFTYDNGAKQRVRLDKNRLASAGVLGSGPSSYQETMMMYDTFRAGFTLDEIHGDSNALRFPFYRSGTKVYLVLWTTYSSNSFPRGNPNGLGESFPVRVKADLIKANGQSVEVSYEKRFTSWTPPQ